MMLRIGNLIVKELIQFGRDRILMLFIPWYQNPV